MKIVLVVGLIAIAGLVSLEVGLRWRWGLGNPLLYVADVQTGYRIAPNQSVRRSGHRIQINQYSMRSQAITTPRPAATLRLLLLGDSIANGGWWTDQADILSEQLARHLQPQLPPVTQWETVEVLNASANSWGPRHELAYLLKFGHFEAQGLILLINTDDLFTIAPTSVQVGRDRNYPQRKPPFALVELIQRQWVKPAAIPELEALHQQPGDRVGANLEAMRQMHCQAQAHGFYYLIAMTPLAREIGAPGSRDYEVKARQRLLELTRSEGIPYIDFLPQFQAQAESAALFRDNIHLSPAGYDLVREAIAAAVLAQFSTPPALPGTTTPPDPNESVELEDLWSS